MKRYRTSGAFLLQKKTSERLIGTAHAGINETNAAYVRIVFTPLEGCLWFSSVNVLRMDHATALELMGILRVLVASAARLDGFHPPACPTEQPSLDVRTLGPAKNLVFECSFEGVEGFDLSRDEELSTLQLSLHLAESLSGRLAEELGRLVAWASDEP